jgi:hypothetical protein
MMGNRLTRGHDVTIRSTEQRVSDTLGLFDKEIDAWVASASDNGKAHLIPLSFHWTGTQFFMALPARSVTARNLDRAGWARIAIGPTRDVVIVEGKVEIVRPPLDDPRWEQHAVGSGFDARAEDSSYKLLILTPKMVQAWRTPAELSGRQIMRDGEWLANHN